MWNRAAINKQSATAKKWLTRGVTFVVTVGAIAGAITAVKALWPAADPPDPEDAARLSVHVIAPQVPLSDYTRRLQSRAPQGFRRAQPTEEPEPLPTDEPTDDPATDIEPPPTDVPEPDPPEPSSTPPSATPTVGGALPGGLSKTDIDTTTEEIFDRYPLCPNADKACRRSVAAGMQGIVAANSTDEQGNKVEPAVAAKRIVMILRESRQTTTAVASREPVGVLVTIDVELRGLRDRPARLAWGMSRTDGGSVLGDWFLQHVAYELRAQADHDQTSVPLWIPLPAESGRYVIDVEVSVDGKPLAAATSAEIR
jgi:hypothetical protein